MASWSTKRKYASLTIFTAAFVLLVALPTFFIFYKAPTCSDGKKNGTETGIDCGGSCTRLCPADFSPIRVFWSHSVKILPGIYNALAYVQNPNPSVGVKSLPYIFRVYDDKGILIVERTGSTFVPAGQKFAVFQGALNVGNRTPARTTFEFTAEPDWKYSASLSSLRVITIDLNQTAQPKATVTVKNDSATREFSNVDAFIVLYDTDDNRVSFSKTIIESIRPMTSQTLTFTWPTAFDKEIIRTEVLFVAR